MAFGRYSIEVDRFQDVVPSEGRQSPKIARPKTSDFSAENPVMGFLKAISPPTEPAAAINYWGSIGSIIGGIVAIFQIYETVSGRKVKNAIADMQKDVDGLIGNVTGESNVTRARKRKKKAKANQYREFKL